MPQPILHPLREMCQREGHHDWMKEGLLETSRHSSSSSSSGPLRPIGRLPILPQPEGVPTAMRSHTTLSVQPSRSSHRSRSSRYMPTRRGRSRDGASGKRHRPPPAVAGQLERSVQASSRGFCGWSLAPRRGLGRVLLTLPRLCARLRVRRRHRWRTRRGRRSNGKGGRGEGEEEEGEEEEEEEPTRPLERQRRVTTGRRAGRRRCCRYARRPTTQGQMRLPPPRRSPSRPATVSSLGRGVAARRPRGRRLGSTAAVAAVWRRVTQRRLALAQQRSASLQKRSCWRLWRRRRPRIVTPALGVGGSWTRRLPPSR